MLICSTLPYRDAEEYGDEEEDGGEEDSPAAEIVLPNMHLTALKLGHEKNLAARIDRLGVNHLMQLTIH